jgi:aspartate kinase
MTCDPKIVPNAKLIKELSYGECIELSFYGAKILHPQTVHPLSYYNIPLYVKNTFDPDSPGTSVKKETSHNNENLAVGISYSKNNTIININGKNLEISDLLYICNMLSKYCNYFNMISLTKSSISIALKTLDPDCEKIILEHLSVNYVVNTIYNISVVSVVGPGLSNTVGIASKIFFGVSSQHINIEMISQSVPQTNITFAVKDEFLDMTLNSVHDLLFM